MGTITPITISKRLPNSGFNRLSVPAVAFTPVIRGVFRANQELAALVRAGSESSLLHKKADSLIHPNYLEKFSAALRMARPCCGTELIFIHPEGATRLLPTAIARFNDGYLMRIFAQRSDLVMDSSISISDIGAGIVHDTNNALTGVLGSSDLITGEIEKIALFLDALNKAHDNKAALDVLKDLPNAHTSLDHISGDIAGIIQSAQHLSGILRGFGEFCARDTKKTSDTRFNVSDAIKSAVAIGKGIIGTIAREKGIMIGLSFDIPEGILSAWGNSDGLQRIMLNLIKNAALEFRSHNNCIKVECSVAENAAKEKFVVIKVKDSGDPIPKSLATRLFREKVDSTHGGSGIGLFTCAQMIHEYGGDIRYESIPDKCFVITLKVAK